jgi:protein-tyrosine-phosphatase
MDELLQKLLEAEVLSADTKAELETALSTKITEAVAEAKIATEADVRTELTEQWMTERDALIEAIDTKIGDFLTEEVAELKDDIDRFRDLEAEYAEKVVEAKAQMGTELKSDLSELVEKLDAFLEIRLAAEVEELREDIDAARKVQFGQKVFEAFASEYATNYADDESLEGTLRETEERLADTTGALESSERKLAKMERTAKLDETLSALQGRQKEVMEAILRNVATEQLEEGYKTFIGRVLRETVEEASEKEGTVLAESASEDEGTLTEDQGNLVTGDNETLKEEMKVEDEAGKAHLTETAKTRLQILAGM